MARQNKRAKLLLERLEIRTLLSRTPWAVLETDDIGNTFRDASDVVLDADGNATIDSQIDSSRDQDMFVMTAAGTGTLQVDMITPDSNLDSYLYVYNSKGRCISRNDDGGDGTDSRVTVNVEQGEVIYIRADAWRRSTGSYTLIIDGPAEGDTYQDDYGDTFEEATVIELSDDGTASQQGEIGWEGDQDMFVVTAKADGYMQVDMTTENSDLDSYLYIYNSDGRLIARDDDSGTGWDASAVFQVQAGESYYIRADAWRWSTGSYELELMGPADDQVSSGDGGDDTPVDGGDDDSNDGGGDDAIVIDTGDGVVEGWALLIASWDYTDTENDLPECQVDLENMEATLIDTYGFDAEQIHTISGGDDVSTSAIVSEFEWLQTNADGDDVVFVYYTGHGSCGDSLYRNDNESFALANGDYFTEANLQEQLNAFDASTTKVVVIDTCYAGGFADLGNTVSNTCVLASSNYYQSSWGRVDQFLPDDAEGSVFTSWLIEAMRDDGSLNVDTNDNGRISMAEAFAYADLNIRSLTHGRNFQDPVMFPTGEEFEIALDTVLQA